MFADSIEFLILSILNIIKTMSLKVKAESVKTKTKTMFRKNNLLLQHGSQEYQRIRMKIIGVITRDGKPRF